MKIINPNVEIIEQLPGIEGVYKQIEQAGRTCYKSEDKITKNSAKAFVDRMIKSNHGAMLEHGTIYMLVPFETHSSKYRHNKYSKVCDIAKLEMGNRSAVTTNFRVLIENSWMEDLQYLCEPTKYHERRITMKFTTNIGVTREGNRHRVKSIGEESTRFCNYDKDKFGKQITYVKPEWVNDEDIDIISKFERFDLFQEVIGDILSDYKYDTINYCTNPVKIYAGALKFTEICYHLLIKAGWTPQQAREVLPLATKTDVVYTAFASDWNHFFNLRLFGETGIPHPNMKEVCEIAKYKLMYDDLWKFVYPNGNLSKNIIK